MEAMEFFQRSAGKWKSQRITHHLPFRRGEIGDSHIVVEPLFADHPKIIELCQLHEIEPSLTIGGAFVQWESSMAWDKDDENHSGNTVFALVPDADDSRAGKLLREKGYAEIVPVVGRYHMDEDDALILITDYETMSIFERFWFASPNLRLRTSTVRGIGGGFSTATFSAEMRTLEESEKTVSSSNQDETQMYSISAW